MNAIMGSLWTWPIAMVCILPLLAIGSRKRLFKVSIPWGSRGRTWLILVGAALAANVSAPFGIFAFAAIDGLAGALILTKRPHGESERAIGLLFIAMLFTHLGFYLAIRLQPGPPDYTMYTQFNQALGWLQWACLLSWGIGYAVERFIGSRGSAGDLLADRGSGR